MLNDSQNAVLRPHPEQEVEEQGIDLLAIVAAYATEWPVALATFAVVLLLGIVLVFCLRSQYVATASLLPSTTHAETESLSSLFAPHTAGMEFLGLLQSRSVADVVVNRAHLLALYRTQSYADARARLAGQSSFTIGPDGIVTISVKDKSAQNAAMIANAYLAGLDQLDLAMAQDQSRQMQNFFSGQLEQEKADLFKAEDQLEQTQEHTGLVQPEAQTELGLNAIAATRAQIVNLQVQLASMLQSETEQNPQVQRLRSQIAQLEAQEASMENGRNSPVGAAPPAGRLPQNNLDVVRAQREVKYHDALVNSLSNQYETARLSQDLARAAFQVVDRAVVPEHKSWPPRKLFLLAIIAFAIFVSLLTATFRLLALRILNDPANRESLRVIRQAFVRR